MGGLGPGDDGEAMAKQRREAVVGVLQKLRKMKLEGNDEIWSILKNVKDSFEIYNA